MVQAEDLRIGDNLRVILIGGEVKWYTITAIDDIFYRDAHSALAAAGTESYAEVTNLNPPAGQLYWIGRVETECNVKIYLKQPAATSRWGTNKSPDGGLLATDSSSILSGRPVNVWIAEDYPPNVQLVNSTNVSITPILWWIGRRFAIKEIKEVPVYYTVIRIGGLSE